MAANIPKLSDLYTSILGDLEAQLSIVIPLFGKNFLRILAAVIAAKQKLQYLALANVQKNIFIDTAEPEAIGGTLERFGIVKLNRRPFTAKAGTYDCTITGDVGAIIKANTTFKSNDSSLNSGKLFSLDNQYTIVVGVNTISLRALEGGLDSRLSVGNKLTATAPLENAEEEVTVTLEEITPLAAEDLEDYRDKGLEAYRLEPQGGAGSDLRLWSKDVQGVLQNYPIAKTGFANEVINYIEATIADSIDGKGTPPAAMLTLVEEAIEFDPDGTAPLDERGRRPLGLFDVNVTPITVLEVDIEIVGAVGITPAQETSILNALTSEIANIRPFIASVDILAEKNDILNEVKIAFFVQKAEPTLVFTGVILKIDTVVTPSILFDNGNIPHLDSVSYV